MRYQHTTMLFWTHLVFRSCSDLPTEPHGIKASRSRCQKIVSPGKDCQHQSWRINFQITTKYALLAVLQQLLRRTYHIHFIVPKIISNLGVAAFTWVSRLANPTLTSISPSRGLRRGTEDAKHLWSAQAEERGALIGQL